MYLFCTGMSEYFNKSGNSCSSYYRVINHYYPLASPRTFKCVELNFYAVFSGGLCRADECAAYVSVFNKTLAVRYTRLLGIADSSINTAVRYSYYKVSRLPDVLLQADVRLPFVIHKRSHRQYSCRDARNK